MTDENDEDKALRSVALQNAQSIFLARQRAERELLKAKEALEQKSEELDRQREWFRVTLASIGDAVIATDLEGRVTYLNPVAEILTGWNLTEAKGLPLEAVFNIVHEETRMPAPNPVSRVLREGAIVGLANHTSLIARDGTETPIEDSAAPIRDANGKTAGAVMVFHDVTERRRAERELRQSELRLTLAMESGQMGAWEWVAASGKVTWSPTLEAIHGIPVGSFSGEFDDFKRDIHPEDLERVLATVQRSVERREDYRIEYRIIKPDGVMTWLEVRGKLFLDGLGNPARMAGICMDISARKQIEEALRASEEFNRTAIESSRDCAYTLDLQGGLLWMNDAARQELGGDRPHEWLGKSWLRFWQSEAQAAARAAIRTAGSGGNGSFVGRQAQDDQRKHWDVIVTPIIGRAGQPEKLLAVARDVTERRKLDEMHSRLAAVVEFSDDAIVSKSLDGIVATWNSAAERIFGYTAEEMIGQPVMLLIPPERANEELEILAKVARAEWVKTYETVRQRKDGTLLNVSLTVSPIKDAQGVIIGASKIARDITQHKKAEAERSRLLALEQEARAKAEKAENRARFLAEASGALVSTLDFEATLGEVARAAVPKIADWCVVHLRDARGGSRQVAGAHADPEKMKLADELRARYPERPDAPAGLGVVMRTGKPLVHAGISLELLKAMAHDEEHLAKLQRLGLSSFIIVPLLANDQVLGAIALVSAESGRRFTTADLPFAEDLAARAAAAAENTRLYQELRHANAAKDHFMAVLSHELRTPLNPVLMTVTDLEHDETLSPALREQMSVVRRNVELEARLIDDLLDSTRISNGKLQLQRTIVDATELIQRAVAIVEGEARAKGVRLEISLGGEACLVDADPARLQQVIWNVVKNAVKFTEAGGWVRLHTEIEPAGRLRVTIEDNGIGIEPGQLGKIFNAFEQGDAGMAHRFGGLGLGLAISKALVSLHGGSLEAQSEGLDRGATFTIKLPLATRGNAAIVPDAVPSTARRNVRLLVVEDHAATASVMVRLLTKRGYAVRTASTVKEAWEVLETTPVDLLISDVGLPDGSGRELMERVRGKQKIAGIALSGYGTEADLMKSGDAGFSMHLTKPVDIDRLDEEIQALVAKMER